MELREEIAAATGQMLSVSTASQMDESTRRALVALNATFYDSLAAPFSDSRAAPQPGYGCLASYFPATEFTMLDVGCGNGRFARYLREQGHRFAYTGIDFSRPLLDEAQQYGPSYQWDLSEADLDGLGEFDLIIALSTVQHIPGRAMRERLMIQMSDHLRPGGAIILANWQFRHAPRQRRKIQPWAMAGIAEEAVEEGDYLLSWDRGGHGLRYVALIDAAATQQLAETTGLRIVEQFRSDGREGDLNLYTVLAQ